MPNPTDLATGTLYTATIGYITTANGAGSTDTTYVANEACFMTEHVGATLLGTTIASVTNATTVELSAAQSWADDSENAVEQVTPAEQTNCQLTRTQAIIDDTSKTDAGVRSTQGGLRVTGFTLSINYTDSDEGTQNLILGLLTRCKLGATVVNSHTASDDYSGNAWCHDITFDTPYDNICTMTAQVTFTGAVTGPA